MTKVVNVKVRKATVDDAYKMDIINRKVMSCNYTYDFWFVSLASECSSSYVLMINNEIVGYILGGIIQDENLRQVGYVYSVGILEEYRRRGYATILFTAFEENLKSRYNIDSVTLHVRKGKTNKGAVSFYLKNDYKIVKTVKGYYGPIFRDGYLMEKKV